MARLNLRMSDELYDLLVRQAARAGAHPAAYARERLAWALGISGAEELAARVAALEVEVERLKRP